MQNKAKMWTTDEVAAATATKPVSWWQWIRQGRCPIKYVRIGRCVRFPDPEVQKLLAGDLPAEPPRPARRRGRPTKAEQIARQQREG